MRAFPFRTFVVVLLVLAAGACGTGADRSVRAVEPAARMTCILLRALTTSGAVDEICATAEELAPFVPELIARRAEEQGPTPARAFMAFSLEASPVAVPRRRCVAWRTFEADGGADGGR
jgi:hypothetical protein